MVWARGSVWRSARQIAAWSLPHRTPPPCGDAQHTVMELRQFGSGRLHLVVNRVKKKLLHSMHATIDDAIDKAGLPLIGVVPEDDALPLALKPGRSPAAGLPRRRCRGLS